MITSKEKSAVQLSPTKKDFYQIWNELLETAGKISERWDPLSTNESDPGIVLLKVLAATADKLNYNIDKNTLEAFMPSASQRESMMKLCDMMGYEMKYYRAATTLLTVKYNGDILGIGDGKVSNFPIDIFTNFKDADGKVNYVSTEPALISSADPVEIKAMAGELVACKTNDENNLIYLNNLDDNYRYYLPETAVAENGIFIVNADATTKGGLITSDFWTRVSNLNTQKLGSKVFKFGFDSNKALPYIQFPEDINTIIGDGLIIQYIRSRGINENIAARTLSVMSKPLSWSASTDTSTSYGNIDVNDFFVTNYSGATDGTNPETLNQAYKNFKKVIGTFDTLVTCRDYMNKIYLLTEHDLNSKTMSSAPVVSNIKVTDIRDDINESLTVCTFDESGINYKETHIEGGTIEPFDLRVYPLRPYQNLDTPTDYENSFKLDPPLVNEIFSDDQNSVMYNCKTIAHKIVEPKADDIVGINLVGDVSAKISTVRKVSEAEEKEILSNIEKALYRTFNARNVEYGEELDYDEVLLCMEEADDRIKSISLADFEYTPVAQVYNGNYSVSGVSAQALTADSDILKKLALRNIIAGRVSLYDYDVTFAPYYGEDPESVEVTTGTAENPITAITPVLNVDTTLTSGSAPTLGNAFTVPSNGYIYFSAENYRTVVTYPAYVNYYYTSVGDGINSATQIPADTDYKLKENERLYLNWTVKTDATEEVHNEVYGAGDIIRPNFTLVDSDSALSYGKTSGFPSEWGIDGMLILGPNEQIEERAKSEIVFTNDTQMYYYFEGEEDVDFTTSGESVVSVVIDNNNVSYYTSNSYILKSNEYLLYTDSNKHDWAYFGSGTKITFMAATESTKFILRTPSEGEQASLDHITQYGIDNLAVTWRPFALQSNTRLVMTEQQVITLSAGDILTELALQQTDDEGNTTFVAVGTDGTLSYEAASCNIAKWTKTDLSPGSLPVLPEGTNWNVYTRYALTTGPNIAQAITGIKEAPGGEVSNDSIQLRVQYADDSETVTLNDSARPYVKTSKQLVGVMETLTNNSMRGETWVEGDDEFFDGFQVKQFNFIDDIGVLSPNLTQVHNSWYQVDLAGLYTSSPTGITIPVVSMNDIKPRVHIYTKNLANVTVSVTPDSGEEPDGEEPEVNGRLTSYDNVESITIAFDPGATISNIAGVVFISEPKYIKGLNPQLGGIFTDTDAALAEANDMVPDGPNGVTFWNTCEIDNRVAIDFAAGETINSPGIWFDKNNINNNFVLAKLNSDNLNSRSPRYGIAISKSSKLK